MSLPTKIKVPRTDSLKAIVPGSVWRQGPFRYDPRGFVVESPALKERIVDEDVQAEGLIAWTKDPISPQNYGVSGSPDDSKAKLFAAYLVSIHVARLGGQSHVAWTTLFGGFDMPKIVQSHTKPTLLVITNLTIDSTQHRIEKARDLMETFPDVPTIVVSCGIDPISFFSTKLRQPIHRLAYFLESQVRTKINVI